MFCNSRVYAGLGTLVKAGRNGVEGLKSGRGWPDFDEVGWKMSGSEPLGQKLFENWQKKL